MSASYNGISFSVYTDGDTGRTARWQRTPRYSEQEVPYADFAYTQYGGRGNWHLTLKINLTVDADYAALEASADGTARTLTNPFGDSTDYTNVLLFAINSPDRQSFSADWNAEAVFTRKGG